MVWLLPLNFPLLKAEEAHVWLAEIPRYADNVNYIENILSEAELSRAKRFVKPSVYQKFVVTRGLLRLVLAKYLTVDPEELLFKYGANGKPFLDQNIHFNVSHSNDLAVFAVSRSCPIGIDIEYKRQLNDLEDICERYLLKHEYEYIFDFPKDRRLDIFYDIWVKKEASIKAIGGRLFEALQQCRDKKGSYYSEDNVVNNFYINDFYSSAIALREGCITIKYWRLPDIDNFNLLL